jgi:hypothetical protein
MKTHHWIGAFVVLIIGYALGVYFPAFGTNLKKKLSGTA